MPGKNAGAAQKRDIMQTKNVLAASFALASLATAAIAAPHVSPAQAKAAAVKKLGGQALSAKYEFEDGHWQYAVLVKNTAGLYEAEVSSTTGRVTATEKTTPAEEASEAAADKKAALKAHAKTTK